MTRAVSPLERCISETNIVDLFGFPGEPWNSAAGDALALELLRARGLRALSDEAIEELARLHEASDASGRFRTHTEQAAPLRRAPTEESRCA